MNTPEQEQLSPREKQVVDFLIEGWTNRKIGAILGISRRTVEDHKARVYLKYRTNTFVGFLRAAYSRGDAERCPCCGREHDL